MKHLIVSLCTVLMATGFAQPPGASVPIELQIPDGMDAAPLDAPHTLNVPEGFDITVYARVPGARFMTFTPEGDLLVSQPDAGKITRIDQTDARVTDLLTGLTSPHDLTFHQVNGNTFLYVAEADQVSRLAYRDGQATDQQVVVSNLPFSDSYRHPLKSLAIDSQGQLLVMIASSTNAGPEDLTAEPKRGAIYTFDAATTNQDARNGTLFAQGLRNAEGLAFVPGTDELWAVVNNRDQIAYPFHNDADGDGNDDYGKVLTDYVDNNPPDEFTHVSQGGNYGWPFCNPDPSTESGYNRMPFNRDFENNADGQGLDCAQATRIDQGIQAHSAPLGLTFLQDTGFTSAYRGAVVPLHGSWNRSAPTGYKVAFFPWIDGEPGEQIDLVTGWLPPDAQSGSEVWGRPVDTAADGQGNLFISDDASGSIYKLSPQTQQNASQ